MTALAALHYSIVNRLSETPAQSVSRRISAIAAGAKGGVR